MRNEGAKRNNKCKKYFIEKPKSEILTIYENNGIIEIEKTNYLLFKIIYLQFKKSLTIFALCGIVNIPLKGFIFLQKNSVL